MRVLIIDNIDSFVYNLYQYVGELGVDVEVRRNNISLAEVERISPDSIIISPGPGTPEKAGVSVDLIRELSPSLPILGVCLGHQAIGYAFGAKIGHARRLMHGKVSRISHSGEGILKGVDNPLIATRYHSLVVKREGLPEELKLTAFSEDDNEVMALMHRDYKTYGVQFHPESILTVEGKRIIRNFIEAVR
ncbi:aminodeoxychorismate synthase component 2 [archaeon]|nr:aminodeoxychorismate synthase component 2 [archaeon]